MVVPTITSQPWCEALATSPAWKLVPTDSLTEQMESGENALVARFLHNDHAIRAMDSYLKTDGSHGPILQDHTAEARIVVDLGRGVDGMPKTCHGGLIALLIDEAAGTLISYIWDRYSLVTGELNTSYRKLLKTPNTVLCRVWVTEGGLTKRKVRVYVSIEDGAGLVYAVGQTVFVKPRAKV